MHLFGARGQSAHLDTPWARFDVAVPSHNWPLSRPQHASATTTAPCARTTGSLYLFGPDLILPSAPARPGERRRTDQHVDPAASGRRPPARPYRPCGQILMGVQVAMEGRPYFSATVSARCWLLAPCPARGHRLVSPRLNSSVTDWSLARRPLRQNRQASPLKQTGVIQKPAPSFVGEDNGSSVRQIGCCRRFAAGPDDPVIQRGSART